MKFEVKEKKQINNKCRTFSMLENPEAKKLSKKKYLRGYFKLQKDAFSGKFEIYFFLSS